MTADRLYAEIQRHGRFWWQVELFRRGQTFWDADENEGTWSVFGERWAKAKARRAVARAKRRPDYRAQKVTIEGDQA